MIAVPAVGVYRPEVTEREGERYYNILSAIIVMIPVSMEMVVVFPAPLCPRRAVI